MEFIGEGHDKTDLGKKSRYEAGEARTTKKGGRSGGGATEGKTEEEEPPRLVGTILE